jgi:DNA-binding HxlR family transcriptional regulator
MNARSDCLISKSLEILGDKWSLLIVRDMMFADKHTYGEFLQSPEKIATNILATRLNTLENNQIIEKTPHPASKAKVWYQLTPKGIALLPLILEISLWAEQFNCAPSEVGSVLAVVKKDKAAFIHEKTEALLAEFKG